MRELPDGLVNPYAPAGTPPARVAHKGPFWCSHAVQFEYDRREGYYFVSATAPDDDELHPKDMPLDGQGALPALCQPATGFDPAEFPNAGPAAIERARLEVLRERRRG